MAIITSRPKSIRTYPPAVKTVDRYGNVKYVAKQK